MINVAFDTKVAHRISGGNPCHLFDLLCSKMIRIKKQMKMGFGKRERGERNEVGV